MTTRLTLGKLLTFAGCIAATPPVVGETLIKVPPIEVHTMKSNRVGDSFEIKVLLPPMIPGEQTRFPVLYMTDVSGEFPNADALRLLMVGDVPRFIAVGIGYPGASGFLQALAMRERDLTPEGTVLGASNAARWPIEGKLQPSMPAGGSPRFLDFIRDELIPFIDSRYPTDPKDRAYWGDSAGGLFGCYVLFTRPDTFNRYIIGSPSAWQHDEDVMKRAERYVATHDDLAATVFLGVGGLEETPDNAQNRMVTNVLRLEKLLRAKKFPGLQLTTHVFPDETHITVFQMNLIRGLVAVYGRPAPRDGLMERYNAAILKQSNLSPAPKPVR